MLNVSQEGTYVPGDVFLAARLPCAQRTPTKGKTIEIGG